MKDKKIKESLKKVYNNIAEDFSVSRAHMEDDYKVLLPYFKKGTFILDLGCGSGRLAAFLKNNHIKTHYIGVDNSEALIKVAKKNNPGFKFEIGDIENYVIQGKNPDLVVCFRTFHHLPSRKSRRNCLKNIQNLTALNGNIFITVWNLWHKDFKHKYNK
ncbi:methyltransferase domain-containing protein, partial [Candidatus Peregrinibacteria bacterium]|nr:methyltransferase domain-containing protein [Candidatus Peregrinibacteria bacterium]